MRSLCGLATSDMRGRDEGFGISGRLPILDLPLETLLLYPEEHGQLEWGSLLGSSIDGCRYSIDAGGGLTCDVLRICSTGDCRSVPP